MAKHAKCSIKCVNQPLAFPYMLAAALEISRAMTLLRSIRKIESLRHFSWSGQRCILKIGDILKEDRVFSDEYVTEYSRVSHDTNPVHFDSEFARSHGFEDRIVHGLLVASLFPRIISSHFRGAVYGSQSLQFKSPVYIGDEITGEVQAKNIKEIKHRFLVKFSTRCFKNGELLVLDGEAMGLWRSYHLLL